MSRKSKWLILRLGIVSAIISVGVGTTTGAVAASPSAPSAQASVTGSARVAGSADGTPGTPGTLAPDGAAAISPTAQLASAPGACATSTTGAITCNVYPVDANGHHSSVSAAFSLPHSVFAGYVVLKIDPTQPNSYSSNWGAILNFINRGDGLADSYQLLTNRCKGCFPSYASILATGNPTFVTENQLGNQNDCCDWTAYYASPNLYNVYMPSRLGPPTSGYSAANWAVAHVGSLTVQRGDPHDRYLSVDHTWAGYCLAFVDTAWEAAGVIADT